MLMKKKRQRRMEFTLGVSKKSKFRTYFKYFANSSRKREEFVEKERAYWIYQGDADIAHRHGWRVWYHRFFGSVLSMFPLLILATRKIEKVRSGNSNEHFFIILVDFREENT